MWHPVYLICLCIGGVFSQQTVTKQLYQFKSIFACFHKLFISNAKIIVVISLANAFNNEGYVFLVLKTGLTKFLVLRQSFWKYCVGRWYFYFSCLILTKPDKQYTSKMMLNYMFQYYLKRSYTYILF